MGKPSFCTQGTYYKGRLMSRETPIWLSSGDSLGKYWTTSNLKKMIPKSPAELKGWMSEKLDSLGYLKRYVFINPHRWVFWRTIPSYDSSHLILTPARIIDKEIRMEDRDRRNVGGSRAAGEEDSLRMKKHANIKFQLCREYF